jgi:Cu/Ag efflux protein CusF
MPAAPAAATEAEKKPAPAVTPAPAKTDPAAREMKSVAGEIVAMDQATRTFTVKHMVDKKPVQMTFSVEDASVMATFKPGDHVKITYAEMGGKHVARSVVKG